MNPNQLAMRPGAGQTALEQSVAFANQLVNRSYLINLNQYPVVPLEDSLKQHSNLRLYKVDKLVFDSALDSNNKLVTVYNAISGLDCSLLIIVDSDGTKVDYYMGVRSEGSAATSGKILEKALLGNFPGSLITGLRGGSIEALLTQVVSGSLSNTDKSVAAVSIVPSERGEGLEGVGVQGIDTFIDTMTGLPYTAIILAKPVSKALLEERKLGFEQMHTALSPFLSSTLSYSESESNAVAEGLSQSTAEALGQSRSKAYGGASTKGGSQSSSSTGGFGGGRSSGESFSTSTNWTQGMADSATRTTQSGTTQSTTQSRGSAKTMQVSYQNRTISGMLSRIDRQLERIGRCEAFGLWECAAYFISQDAQNAVIAANTYRSMMSGEESGIENSFVNLWGAKDSGKTRALLEYAKYGLHPAIRVADPGTAQWQIVNPASLVSGNELPLMMGVPKKSVTGINTVKIAEFGRNIFTQIPGTGAKRRSVDLGCICHMGLTEATPVQLDVDSLSAHCFICGSTGSGKSNTSYRLLEELMRNGVKFLVIEPAKGEYRKEFGALPDVNVYTTNPDYFSMLHINPFHFPEGVHVLEHLDRLIEIFNACWPMFGSMPAILKEGLEKIYMLHGWDLNNSTRMSAVGSEFPTFTDLIGVLPTIINNSSYSKETKNEYTGALVTRISSLTNGILGQIFCGSYSISNRKLFDSNTIVDISRVGSSETKALLMGLLILKLSEYRSSAAEGGNSSLQHVTVLEEAHNILKRTSTEQSIDSANVAGKAVEMLSASIAEMRTYGEGFVIIDQSPGAVDVAAIKNTNTKIIMRLPDESDCIAVGKAASMREDQIAELARLSTGAAVVFQNNWLEPVMVKVHKSSGKFTCPDEKTDFAKLRLLRGRMLVELYRQFDAKAYDTTPFVALCDKAGINRFKKAELMNTINSILGELKTADRKLPVMQAATADLCVCLNLFDIYPLTFDYGAAMGDPVPAEIVRQVREYCILLREKLSDYVKLNNAQTVIRAVNFLLCYMAGNGRPDSMKYKIMLRVLQKKT